MVDETADKLLVELLNLHYDRDQAGRFTDEQIKRYEELKQLVVKALGSLSNLQKIKNEKGELSAEYVIGRMNYCSKDWLKDWEKIPRGLMKLSESTSNSTFPEDWNYIEDFEMICDILGENSDEECEKIIKEIIKRGAICV